jgi:hypothetical protein
MVERLNRKLPPEFLAEPWIHLGPYSEVYDRAEFDEPEPAKIMDSRPPDEYAYEVKVFDHSRNGQLVAAVEFVCPANKVFSGNRRAFETKCAALLHQGVCVSIVDIVTNRRFNLYAELLALMEWADPAFSPTPSPVYAVTCRARNVGDSGRFESWAYPFAIGQPLPDLPIWLTEDQCVTLDLEASYEDVCRTFRIV